MTSPAQPLPASECPALTIDLRRTITRPGHKLVVHHASDEIHICYRDGERYRVDERDVEHIARSLAADNGYALESAQAQVHAALVKLCKSRRIVPPVLGVPPDAWVRIVLAALVRESDGVT